MANATVSHQQIVDSWYDAWNRRDWKAIEDFAASELTFEDIALGKVLQGKKDYLGYIKAFANAFPDGKIVVDRISGSGRDGEATVVEYHATGTQTGPFGLFAPTNLKCKFRFCDILRFMNGQLVSCRTYWDLYGPLADLGHVVSRRRGQAA